MPATFLVVPEWQGSGSSRAMQLIDGADAIAGDLPAAVTRRVAVPLGAGESLGSGVNRVTALRSIRDAQIVALREEAANNTPDSIVITIGGDCSVELAPVGEAALTVSLNASVSDAADDSEASGRLAVVWLDAHPDVSAADLDAPGAFSNTVLRTLLGDGTELLVPDTGSVIAASNVILAGVRAVDDDAQEYIDANDLKLISTEQLQGAGSTALVDAIIATGAVSVYLHVDLDVLDPAEIAGLSFPEPFGLTVAELVDTITAVRRRFSLVGAGITQFAPSSPDAASDDLSAVLRIISALTRNLTP